jgi:hypothetical protein
MDGGAEGSRTPDLLIANETLYQLSYDPIQFRTRNLQMAWKALETLDAPVCPQVFHALPT